MIILVSGATTTVARYAGHPNLGELMRPGNGNSPTLPMWAADNGAFAGFNEKAFLSMLDKLAPYNDRTPALWVVSPDVVGDPISTTNLYAEWAPLIRERGFKVAYVLQDGCERVPWDCDCLFVGGSTEYKLSEASAGWIKQAKRRGKWVHLGRVNSVKRMQWAYSHNCDSFDGTSVSMFPDRWLPWTLQHLEKIVTGQSRSSRSSPASGASTSASSGLLMDKLALLLKSKRIPSAEASSRTGGRRR